MDPIKLTAMFLWWKRGKVEVKRITSTGVNSRSALKTEKWPAVITAARGETCLWAAVAVGANAAAPGQSQSHRWSRARTVPPGVKEVTHFTTALKPVRLFVWQACAAVSMCFLKHEPNLENHCGETAPLGKIRHVHSYCNWLVNLRSWCTAALCSVAFIHIYWFVSTSSLKTRECFSCVCWLKTLLKNLLPQFWKQQIGPTALQQEPWTPFRCPPREKRISTSHHDEFCLLLSSNVCTFYKPKLLQSS